MSQAAPDIYVECLLPLKHGYPLYRPEPDHGLPRAYRTKGVSIGDVGIITPEGYFDFLFNICQEAGATSDANNANVFGVPNGQQVVVRGEVVEDPNYFGTKAVVANGSEEHTSISARGGTNQIAIAPVSAGAGLEFTCSNTRGAILVLPDGATYTVAKSTGNFLHSLENVRAWFQHAVERGRVCNSLTLVTGHIKCKSWGVAAISNTSKSESVSLNFSLAGAGDGSLSASHSWQGYSPWMCNSGPKVTSRKANQCVFISGFRITRQRRLSPLRLLSEVKVTDLREGISSYPRLGNAKYGSFGASQGDPSSATGWESQAPATSGGSGGSQQTLTNLIHRDGSAQEQVTNGNKFVIEGLSDTQEPYHPLNIINEYLLDKFPKADFAVSHDHDWWELIEEGECKLEDEVLVDRIEKKFYPVISSGVVFLQARNMTEEPAETHKTILRAHTITTNLKRTDSIENIGGGSSESSSQRKSGSRSFKDRRAAIACQRCRHLKKGCKQTGREKCERCFQTDQVCVYMDVAHDPTAARQPGSSPPIVPPDSPTLAPSEPPSPTFEIYQNVASSDQPDGIESAPHLTRLRNDLNNPILLNRTAVIHANMQGSGPPMFSSSQSVAQSLSFYPDVHFDTTYPYIHGNGVYNDPGPQHPFMQTPAGFTQKGLLYREDITDFPP